MLCERCHQKQAIVHLAQFINGQKTELHLCQECAEQMESSVTFEQFFSGLLNVLGGMPGNVSPQVSKKQAAPGCPTCGLSFEEFKKSGRLGCAQCYDVFKNELESCFKSIQGAAKHEGKFPQKAGVELLNKKKVNRLKLALAKAVEEEQFEEAASLRDQIKELEALK